MKIVHVLNSLTVGGREKVVVELCNELVKNESITIITLTNNDNQLKSSLHPNIKLIELPFKTNILGILKLWFIGFFLIKSKLNKIQPDIVHNHLYYHYYLLFALANFFRKVKSKSFRTIHTSGLYFKEKGLLNYFRLWVEKFATTIDKPYIISISKTIYENNEKFFYKRHSCNRYIPNGVNFSKMDDIEIYNGQYLFSDKDFVGVYVARLDNGKNHSLVINIISELRLLGYDIKMLFVGDGTLRKKLEEQVADKDLTKNIFFVGFSENVSSYLKLANFAVFPSDFEGFPLSLIEKMYFRLPVVASNIDIFRELIREGENGFLFDLKDSKEFRDKIVNLLNNKELSSQIGKQSKEDALKFDIYNVVNSTIDYYKNSLG